MFCINIDESCIVVGFTGARGKNIDEDIITDFFEKNTFVDIFRLITFTNFNFDLTYLVWLILSPSKSSRYARTKTKGGAYVAFTGLGVVVRCGRDGQVGGALTNDSGWFKVNMRRPGLLQSAAPCYAMLVSGPRRRCRFKDGHSMARVVDGRLTSPLTFSPASCVGEPSQGLGPASIRGAELGDSKTIDLPLPREWGLPPTSYYTFPVIPIGIP